MPLHRAVRAVIFDLFGTLIVGFSFSGRQSVLAEMARVAVVEPG